MFIKSERICERSRHFGRLPILSLFLLNLLCLVALVDGRNSFLETVEGSGHVSPEKTLLDFFAKSFDPEDGTVSAECQEDSTLYRAALYQYKPWALQMYDSSTKIPFGVISGNYKQLGNYDECLKVQSDHGFVGKACSAKVRFLITSSSDSKIKNNDPGIHDLLLNAALASGLKNWSFSESVPYEWLWCVPSSCSARDVAESIEFGLDPLKRSPKVDFVVTVGNDSCHTKSSDRAIFVTADWIYISLLLLFGIIIVVCTIYDLVHQRYSENPNLKDTRHKILTCFSVYTNGKSLLNVQRNVDTIACLDGIRFLTICWIIYGHTVHQEINGVLLDLSGVSTMHERWHTLLYLNVNVATDTFFLLSGTLLAYSEIGRKEKNPESYKFNIWKLYLHRYLRLTPSYAMIIGFYATLFYKTGSGPRWDDYVGANSRYCVENWWRNLLYVNNYIDLPSMCMLQSWYLAADMQMAWLSPILLYPMLGKGKRNQKIFLILLTTTLCASILAPFLVTYCERLTGTMLFYKDITDLTEVYLQIYSRVYTRGGSYLVGLGLGYFLRWIKHKKTTMPTVLVFGGWTIAVVMGLAVVFGPREFYFRNHEYNVVEAAFYAGFHRPAFALAVGWIVVASVSGCAGPVGALLSWSAWAPLSRLTYSAYLSHYIILLYNVGSSRTPAHYTIFSSVHAFCGNLVLTLLISVILYLCIELPFCRLDQLLVLNNRFNLTKRHLKVKESKPEIYRSSSSIVAMSCNGYIDKETKNDIESMPQSSNEDYNSYAQNPSTY